MSTDARLPAVRSRLRAGGLDEGPPRRHRLGRRVARGRYGALAATASLGAGGTLLAPGARMAGRVWRVSNGRQLGSSRPCRTIAASVAGPQTLIATASTDFTGHLLVGRCRSSSSRATELHDDIAFRPAVPRWSPPPRQNGENLEGRDGGRTRHVCWRHRAVSLRRPPIRATRSSRQASTAAPASGTSSCSPNLRSSPIFTHRWRGSISSRQGVHYGLRQAFLPRGAAEWARRRGRGAGPGILGSSAQAVSTIQRQARPVTRPDGTALELSDTEPRHVGRILLRQDGDRDRKHRPQSRIGALATGPTLQVRQPHFASSPLRA